MPKKKANNRLNNLFDGLKPETPHSKIKGGDEKTRQDKEQIIEQQPPVKTVKVKEPAKTKPLSPIEIEQNTSTPSALIETQEEIQPRKSEAPAHRPGQEAQVKAIPKNAEIGTVTQITPDGASTLSFAFQAKDDDWAILRIIADANRQWTEDEQLLVKQVTDQLSLALENAYLFQDSQRRASEMTALAEIGREISSSLKTEDVLNKITEYALNLLRCTTAAIYLPNEEFTTMHSIAVTGDDMEEIKNFEIKIGTGIIGRIALTRTGEIINNVNNDSRAVTIQGTDKIIDEHIMVVPILTQDTLRGILATWRTGYGQEFIKTEFDFLTSLAQQTAVIIENARLFQEEQRRASELQAVSEISSAVSTILNEQRLLEEFAYLTRKRFNLYHARVFMLDDERQNLYLRASGWAQEERKGINENLIVNIDQTSSLAARASRTQQTIIQNDINEDPSLQKIDGLPDIKSEMAIPIFSQERLLGILNVYSDHIQAFSDSDAAIMVTLATQIGAVIQNTRLFQQIRASQNQLSEALRIARLGYSETDPVSATMTLTDELYALLETTSEQESGYTHPIEYIIKTYVVPEDREKAQDALKQAMTNKQGDSSEIATEIRFKTRSEKIIWVRTIYKAEFDPTTGKPVKVISSAQDITENKIAEEAIQRRNQYLATSAEISRIVTSTLDLQTIFARTVNLVAERFNLYHAAIFTTDETKFSASFREGTGAAGEELKKEKYHVQVNDRSVVGSVVWNGEAVVINDVSTDLRYKQNPLLPETRSEAGVPLRIGNRTIGVLDLQSKQNNAFSENDLSVLQTLADQVAIAIDNARSFELSQQAVLEMRETDRVKTQFLANMSHELRTPLNSIIGFSRVILKGIDGPVTELQQQDLTAIYNSGQHLLALINDILDLAKIEAGKMELAYDDVNMIDLINSVLSTATGLVKDKPITLRKILPEQLPHVRADAIRMRQVLLNLISNAAKFTDEGEIFIKAELRPGENNRQELWVGVTDSGPGISPEDQKKLFQAFSQVDDSPTRKTGGTGLGLSISSNLVQMHGGKISVDSAIGRGSTFYFTMPVIQPDINEDGSEVKTILVVDDDIQVISLYERYLQPQGFQIVAITDPSKVKEKALQIKPYAITLDIMMPNIDGWKVLSELKSDQQTREIPVIVCSILEEQEKGFSLGASDYLTKPILEEDLLDALDRLNADGTIKEVMVVDDDPNDLRLIGKMLNDQGRYKSVLVEGGAQGWTAIQTNPPQALIIDLFMPDMDGFTIIEKMRAIPRLRDIPVIMVTGKDIPQEQQQRLSKMGQLLISKSSLTADELLITMERALQRMQTKKKKENK